MALHKNFPRDPYKILDPSIRWFPADEDLREQGYEKLLPPFVPMLREEVKKWRENNYESASATSKALLNWWFKTAHTTFDSKGIAVPFRYYFAQREAVETIIWLYDVAKVESKYDLLKYDKLGRVSPNMFREDWLRFVVKMATGSGKTKVMSLLLAWAYFHKMYEKDSGLARNFLLITPNIIVLERIKTDFEGLKIFYEDPILPDNGYEGQNWQDDFQVTLHLQDEVRTISTTGNIFLTNIHRVFEGDVREAVSDYPLVEAIRQRVVKNPVLPDQASRAKLIERKSSLFTEKYEDFIRLGVEEWRKTYKELEPTGKRSILFIMTDDTTNCDDVASYLEKTYSDLKGAVLTIHTNKSGEISETVKGKDEEELRKLREQANAIDSLESPFKAIVSVLMLKEGWDVRNVTTIVGLRAYSAKSNILPVHTLGRGLRRMFFGRDDVEEYVSVIGTPAFMEFVESIKMEGVELEKRKMGAGVGPITPIVIEVDNQNVKKDIPSLDIELPILTPRIQREYKNLGELNLARFGHKKIN